MFSSKYNQAFWFVSQGTLGFSLISRVYLFKASLPSSTASTGRAGAMSVPFITESLAFLGLAHGHIQNMFVK